MNRQELEQKVKEVIAKQLGADESKLTPEARFSEDLGADSLDTVELVMAFEQEFKDQLQGEIPEADAEKLRTVGSVIDYICSKTEGK